MKNYSTLKAVNTAALLFFGLIICCCAQQKEHKVIFDFENETPGQLPSGWSQYGLGEGTADWKIQKGEEGLVLAQTESGNPNRHYNIVVYEDFLTKNPNLSVDLKSVSGEHDWGGGFVWRFQDKNNHYIVRSNPMEKNVVLYKVEDGKRTDLPLVDLGRTYGVEVEDVGKSWHNLKLKVKDYEFVAFLNGDEIFRVIDSTFINAGKVGLWTKADAVTLFDDFVIKGD